MKVCFLLLTTIFVWLNNCCSCRLDLPPFGAFENDRPLPHSEGSVSSFGDVSVRGVMGYHDIMDFEYINTPISADIRQQNAHMEHVMINDHHKFECYVPVSKQPVTEFDNDANILAQGRAVVASIGDTCLRLKGSSFWEYEFCPMKHVKQIHVVDNGTDGALGALKKVITIGGMKFAVSGDVTDAVKALFSGLAGDDGDIASAMDGGNSTEAGTRYEILLGRHIPRLSEDLVINGHFVQTYLGGDVCGDEDTGVVRETLVHYECSMLQDADHLIEAREVQFCKYSLRVGTQKLCMSAAEHQHVDLKNFDRKLQLQERTIKCYPQKVDDSVAPSNDPEILKQIERAPPATANAQASPEEAWMKDEHGNLHPWVQQILDISKKHNVNIHISPGNNTASSPAAAGASPDGSTNAEDLDPETRRALEAMGLRPGMYKVVKNHEKDEDKKEKSEL